MIDHFRSEFARYRTIGEKALSQLPDVALNKVPVTDGNSAAMLVRHISGNLASRFTDFLTTDGEKPWRNREGEFEERAYTREEVDRMWGDGFGVLESTLEGLSDSDLNVAVRIRGQEWTVHAALARSLAHLSYHIGQLVLLARLDAGTGWDWITIPKNASDAYNQRPDLDRGFSS